MHVVAKSILKSFWESSTEHTKAAKQPLQAWHAEAENATWRTSADIKMQYRNASILMNGRVVFSIKGDDYRLVVKVHYGLQRVYICWVGTHGDFNDIEAESSMHGKLIKTKAAYKRALARVGDLIDADPKAGTPRFDELELLSTLVELYEKEHFPIDLPDPISAIKFRMEQMGLQPKDVIPFVGSASKVSEVLNGKRELTLRMIRALHKGLGIPADVLLQEKGAELPAEIKLDYDRFPWGEMVKRGWFRGVENYKAARDDAEKFIRELIPEPSAVPALYRRSVRQGAEMDEYALTGWTARIVKLAYEQPMKARYQPGSIGIEFVRDLRSLSFMTDGPRLAREYLVKNGIRVVVERHLPKTRVDGAATLLPDGAPVIGLSLRYNRLDYFWFCLFHELAHIHKHLTGELTTWFIDDLDSEGGDNRDAEDEADQWAQDMLINPADWDRIKDLRHEVDVRSWANRLCISPAIIAGRIRREQGDYRLLSRLVGQGELHGNFSEMSSAGA